MNLDLQRDLQTQETDIDGALNRLSGDEDLYIECLRMFLKDPTMDEMRRALADRSWDDVFTAAHAMKGLAGNMGFVPLYHASAEFVTLIRAGRLREIDDSCAELTHCYQKITDVIRKHCGDEPKGE